MSQRQPITARNAARQPFMPLMRELVRAYQAWQARDAEGHRAMESGLTLPQADVIFTLGNTTGMSCKNIGERTLITKGTLTGIIDRLEDKGLVTRETDPEDRRSTIVRLTPEGEAAFERCFPLQISYLAEYFQRLSPQQMEAAQQALRTLREAFE
ncbi:MAG: MarR family transcriptional regulator [Xanthomonadales bacterium]|nr:MarR family transcriptional regulator [Xanthomonadales bacterium]